MRYTLVLFQWVFWVTFAQLAFTLPNLLTPWQEESSPAAFSPQGLASSHRWAWYLYRESPRTLPKRSLHLTAATVIPTNALNEREPPAASSSAPTSATHVSLPLRPKITPASSVAGILLICLGIAYTLIGVKIRWILVPVGVFFLIDIAVTVLLAYVAKPPISEGTQGAYLGAIFGAGFVLSIASWFFKEVTEGLVCLLGGYCFSMWILVLHPGSSIHTSGARAIFIVVISVASYALWFSRYTRDYGLMACSSFAGATALAVGIDCFSQAGMKEFWLYIWALNDKIFPLGTSTYPLTKGLRIEVAVIILAAVAGTMSQMRLWLVLKERRTYEQSGFLKLLRDPHPREKISTLKSRHDQPQRYASWRMLLRSRRQRRSRRFPLDVEEPFENGLPRGFEDSQLSRSVAEELEMRFFSAFTLPPIGESLRGAMSSKPSRLSNEEDGIVLNEPGHHVEEQSEDEPTNASPQTASRDTSTTSPAHRQVAENASVSSPRAAVKRKPLPPRTSRSAEQVPRPSPSPQSTEISGQDAQSVYITPDSDREEFVRPLMSEDNIEHSSEPSIQTAVEESGKPQTFETTDPVSSDQRTNPVASGPDRTEIKRPRLASSRNYLLREPRRNRSRNSSDSSTQYTLSDSEPQSSPTEMAAPGRGNEPLKLSVSEPHIQEELMRSRTPSIPQRSRHRSIPLSSDLMRTSIDENSETDFDSLNGSHSSLKAPLMSPQSHEPNNSRKRHTLSTLRESSIPASERLQRLRDTSSSRYSSTGSLTSFATRSDPLRNRSLRSSSEGSNWNPLLQEADNARSPWGRSNMGFQHIQPGHYYQVEQGPLMTPQAGRRSFTDPDRRAEMLATWRESVRQEMAISNAPHETADSRRVEMLMDKQQDRLNQLQREAANIRREQAYDQLMRSRGGQEAHREVMQKMQASANRHL